MKIILHKGQTLVELVLVMGLAAVLLPALLTGFLASRDGTASQEQRGYATALLKESESAVTSFKNNDWTSFSALSPGTYHTVISGNKWNLESGSITDSNEIKQEVVLSDVRRDSTGSIVAPPAGTPDPSTKKVEIILSWTKPSTSSITSTLYFARTKNAGFTETTQVRFNTGIKSNTVAVTSTPNPTPTPGDGQVQLTRSTVSGGGDWCNPSGYVVKTFDLPGQGVVNAISAKALPTQNVAYTTTGGNASGNSVDSLVVTRARPPVVTNPSANNEAKAYGIYVDNTNSYVYFNENNPPNHTVRIANGTTLANVGYFDASANGDGSSVFALGTAGYTTVGSKLYKFDISTIKGTSSQDQQGVTTLAGNGKKVVVVGTNAYVATSSTTSQLQIINTTTMTITKNINLGNNLGAVDLYVDSAQAYAYVITSFAVGKNNLFIIDLNNTTNIYGYVTNGNMNPKGITVVPSDKKAIVVGVGGELYQVFDITTPSAAVRCGGMTPTGVTSINAVDSVIQDNGYVFSYILTDNSSSEFQIIEGGSQGEYSMSGTFESSTFDTNSLGYSSVAFNRFLANINQPANTSIRMQVAAIAPVSGSCPTLSSAYKYVGPNGNDASYFTPVGSEISGVIPYGTYYSVYKNPERCFRYKAWLDTAVSTQTPVIYDMNLNYSL